jgi:hypothetical protein
MRATKAIWIIGLVVLPGFARGDDKEARVILERAIKAQGGAKALTRAAQLKRKDSGTHITLAGPVGFTGETIRSLPDRVRLSTQFGGNKTVLVLNGDKAWQSDGGPAVELLPARVKEVREEVYIEWISTLVPLTRSGFTLSTLPKIKVDGETAVGIKAVHKGRPDVRLYFLQGSGLLARIERQASEAGLKVDKAYQFGAYKDFDGVKLPTKQTVLVNGKKFTEFTSSEVTFPAKLDAKTFAKP